MRCAPVFGVPPARQPSAGCCAGMAATVNWVTNAVVAQSFLPMMRLLGGSGTFWCYAACAAGGLAWVWAVLPETSGLTLDQVQALFGGPERDKGARDEED